MHGLSAGLRALLISVLVLASALGLAAKRSTMTAPPSRSRSHLWLEVGDVRSCNMTNNALKMGSFETIIRGKNEYRQSANFSFTRQSTDRLKKLSIIMTKCREYVSYNTCEHWQTWKFPANICGMLIDPKTPWYPLTSRVHPTLKCPFEKKDYHLKEGTFDTRMLETLGVPLEKNVWHNRIEVEDQNGLFVCFIMDKVTYVRVKSNER